jgi:hypothetical protein
MLISWGNFFSFLGIWAEAPEREKRDQVLGMAGREGGMGRMERKLRWEDILQEESSRFRAS